MRDKVMAAIERLARAEAAAAGSDREPEIELVQSFPAVVNDVEACTAVSRAFSGLAGVTVVDPGSVTGSEDVGILARESGAPCAYWLLGGSDPSLFAQATGVSEIAGIVEGLPSNHSPHFAPVPAPTLEVGIAALTAGAKQWLS